MSDKFDMHKEKTDKTMHMMQSEKSSKNMKGKMDNIGEMMKGKGIMMMNNS